MIKTQEEYKDALSLISQDLEMYDFELPEKMNSYVYNLYLQDIEYYLDLLYVKYRAIEDLCDYLELYTSTKINKMINDIAVKQKTLENNIDKFIDNKSIAYEIEWDKNDNVVIYDRDGSGLLKADTDTYNQNIRLKRTYGDNIQIKSIEKENSNFQSYSDNILTCLDDKYYYSCYTLDYPDEIKEVIKFNIDDAALAKYIELTPVNCKLEVEDNKVTLKASSMSKIQENFNMTNYNNSALNNLTGINSIYNQSNTIKENENRIASSTNNNIKDNYIKTVSDFQEIAISAENISKINKEMV